MEGPLSYNESLVNDWEDVSKALREINSVKNDLLLYLKELLDDYHGCQRSADYYNIIAGDWLISFTHVAYVAWLQSIKGERGYNNGHMLASDHDQFLYMCVGDRAYGDQLHRHLIWSIEQLHCKGNRERPLVDRMNSSYEYDGGRNTMQSLYKAGMNLVSRNRKPDIKLCRPYYKCDPLTWISTVYKWHKWLELDDFDYVFRFNVQVDNLWRNDRATQADIGENLVDILKALLPLYLPVVLLEGYLESIQTLHENKVKKPKAVFTGNALHGHLPFKFLVAEWLEDGVLLLNQQHGGGYGIDHELPVEDYEVAVSDRFYSWGWSGVSNIHPLSIPYSKQRTKHNQGKDILMNCVDYPQHYYRIQYKHMPGNFYRLIQNTTGFIDTLGSHKNLVIRPYIRDYNSGMSKSLLGAASGVDIDSGKRDSRLAFLESKLVVHNYMGTSWLETCAMNIPTVCFYDPSVNHFRDKFVSILHDLERVGIVHRSGIEAGKFINGLGNNIDSWWLSSDVQEARFRLADNYARYSVEWPREWEHELLTMAA